MKSSVSRKVFARILPFFTFYTGCLPFIILFQKLFFMKESDFNIKPVSMSTKRIYFTAYFNYHEICTYWMENVLKAPYNARNLYLLTNGYIHMRPKNELLFLHYVKHEWVSSIILVSSPFCLIVVAVHICA